MQSKVVGGGSKPDYSLQPTDPNNTISPLDLQPPPQPWEKNTHPAMRQRGPRFDSEMSLADSNL